MGILGQRSQREEDSKSGRASSGGEYTQPVAEKQEREEEWHKWADIEARGILESQDVTQMPKLNEKV